MWTEQWYPLRVDWHKIFQSSNWQVLLEAQEIFKNCPFLTKARQLWCPLITFPNNQRLENWGHSNQRQGYPSMLVGHEDSSEGVTWREVKQESIRGERWIRNLWWTYVACMKGRRRNFVRKFSGTGECKWMDDVARSEAGIYCGTTWQVWSGREEIL